MLKVGHGVLKCRMVITTWIWPWGAEVYQWRGEGEGRGAAEI